MANSEAEQNRATIRANKLAESSPSFAWLLHFTDRESQELRCSPPSTLDEVLHDFPDVIAAEPIAPVKAKPDAQLTRADEAAIRAWLDSIGEHDPDAIAETLATCRADTEARNYFIARATR